MAATREQVAELVMKIFDRLEKEFPNAPVEDALILVELSDKEDLVELEDGREVPATVVLCESTTDRVVIQGGIIEFARQTIIGAG
jgi:hypothetical protein